MYKLVKNNDSINLIVISDLHLCNKLDRLDLLYKAYEYASYNEANYIINLGDLIDSNMPHNSKNLTIKNINKQIEFVIDNYPLCYDIKTLILYGNHDYFSNKYNVDVANTISDKRPDLINLGYGEAYISILDNYIKLNHEINYLKNYKKNIETFITLLGHYHGFKIKNNDDSVYIYAPTLSNLGKGNEYVTPSILDIKIDFYNDLFSKLHIKCIDIENEIINSEFDLSMNISNKKHIKINEDLNKFN